MNITKIETKELRAIVAKHYPNVTIVDIEDVSKGCDNWIFCVDISSTQTTVEFPDRIIVRIPRKLSEPDCPAMHWPRLQAQVLTTLTTHGIPVPKLLHESSNYLIESYLSETDLSNIVIKDRKQLKEIFAKIGYYVKKWHSIDCCHCFGYIIDFDSNSQKFVGKYDKWITMFEIEFPVNLNECLDRGLITREIFEKLNQFFDKVKPYLESYCAPKLLHSDICGNNCRVLFNSGEECYELNGFIDWADCMCGDPMYDLGELLLSYFGDYSIIEMFECGYGTVSLIEKQMITFYAIHYNIWLLNSCLLSEDHHKWMATLDKLTGFISI